MSYFSALSHSVTRVRVNTRRWFPPTCQTELHSPPELWFRGPADHRGSSLITVAHCAVLVGAAV